MFSKVMVILRIVLYFDCICLFCFGVDWYHNYKTEVVDLGLNDNQKISDFDICTVPKELWAHMCNRVLVYLRKTYQKYENAIYLNYKAFTVLTNDKCKFVKVRVPLEYGFTNELVHQIALHCYANGPLDEPLNVNSQFYKKIVIYSHKCKKELMIFEQIENTNEYELLDWNINFSWEKYKLYSPAIFQIPMPERQNLSEITNTFFVERNPDDHHNIVIKSKTARMYSMCTLLYARWPYNKDFVLDKNKSNFNYRREVKNIFFPNGNAIRAKTFTCPGFLKNPDMVPTTRYRLTSGPEKNDIIIIIDTNNDDNFEAVELIRNLYREYLFLIFPTPPTDSYLFQLKLNDTSFYDNII